MNYDYDRKLPPRGSVRRSAPAIPPSPAPPPPVASSAPRPAPASTLVQPNFLAALLDREIVLESLAGVERRGVLRRFDQFSLVLLVDGRETLVYKHSIAAICQAP